MALIYNITNHFLTDQIGKKNLALLSSVVILLNNTTELLRQFTQKLNHRRLNLSDNPNDTALNKIYHLAYNYLVSIRKNHAAKYNIYMRKLNIKNEYQPVDIDFLKEQGLSLFLAGIPRKLVMNIMYLQYNQTSSEKKTYLISEIENIVHEAEPSQASLDQSSNQTIQDTDVVDLTC